MFFARRSGPQQSLFRALAGPFSKKPTLMIGAVIIVTMILILKCVEPTRQAFDSPLKDESRSEKPTLFRGRGKKIQGKKKMPMKVLDATVSTFEVVFDKFKSEAPNYQANLILFLADKDPSTNLSWCPDCVRAEPVIYKKLESSSDEVALLRAYVGDRPTWRNPHHPWRSDSIFKLRGVPTLILWEDGAIKARLEDHEAHLDHKIDTLVSGN